MLYCQWLDWLARLPCWSPGVTLSVFGLACQTTMLVTRCYSQWLDWLARVPCWVPGVTLLVVGLACQTTMLVTWCYSQWLDWLARVPCWVPGVTLLVVGLACQTTMLVTRCYTVSGWTGLPDHHAGHQVLHCQCLDWLARLPCWSPGITLSVFGLACQTTMLVTQCYTVSAWTGLPDYHAGCLMLQC